MNPDATKVSPRHAKTAWSPARIYLVVSGVFLLVIGSAGFLVSSTFPIGAREVGSAAPGHIFGIFETNGWHNLAGLASGAVALGFAQRPELSRLGALIKGGFYVGVTASIALWGGETFWIASNTADQVLHATLALGGVATGLVTSQTTRQHRADVAAGTSV